MQVNILPIQSFEELGKAWRALEAEAATASFFQSWTWVGCLAEERYDDPVLVEARSDDNRVLGMVLFNRQKNGRLCLAETGKATLDAPFTEHNAPLVATGTIDPTEMTRLLLRVAWRVPGTRRLVLSGVPPAVLEAAGGVPYRLREQTAPMVDLNAIRAGSSDWLSTLSANTRYQLRRSIRYYAQRGPLRLQRAGTVEEALAWFDALVALHGENWRRRGQPGAFAHPFSLHFHRALVQRAEEQGELDLLRLSAGSDVLGYLYNFRFNGRVYAYQSGLDHSTAGRHGKPGLTCHAMAIERALQGGDTAYDFLAGAARYKLSLANTSAPLLWAEAVPRLSLRGLVSVARDLARRATGPQS